MKYGVILPGRFLSRPNRFIAHVEIDGQTEVCHVKNTGRCRELLLPGAKVYVEQSTNSNRKTKFDLIAVEKGDRLINMDSQAPNRVAAEWLNSGGLCSPVTLLRPETVHGDSRFDFYLESGQRRIFLEVKGVTLEKDGLALFPDAPTLRGVKHIEGLCRCVEEGLEACLLFVIQMEQIKALRPNDQTHPAFGVALRRAQRAGVRLLAYECQVSPDSLKMARPVPIQL